MENEIELIMEEIEKDPERLKQMLGIEEIDELYQFFTENGYKQSFERFKEEVNSLRESLKSRLQEDSDFENIAGGINIKNKLTKTTSIGLASLLALGSPVGYASNSKVPNKPTEQNISTKKQLKSLGIKAGISGLTLTGIGVTALAIWEYHKHFGSGKKPKQTRVNEESTKAEKQPEEETNSYDKPQDDISSDESTKPDQDEGSGTQSTGTEDLPIEEKEESTISQKSHDDTSTSKQTHSFTTELNRKITVDPVSTDLSHVSPPPSPSPTKTDEITPLSTTIDSPSLSDQRSEETFTQSKNLYSGEELNGETNPVDGNSPTSQTTLTADVTQEKNPQTIDDKEIQEDIQNLTANEQLIKQVLAEDMVEPFKKLFTTEQEEVIELVKQIQGILGVDAHNLGRWVHDDIRLDCIKYNWSWMWVNYICNALDGYLRGTKQQEGFSSCLDLDLYHLILSFVLCNGENQTEKVKRVKQCIDYLYINLDKHYNKRKLRGLLPDELIKEVQALNGNMEFSDNVRDNIFYSRTVYIKNTVSFVHLLYHALKQNPSLNGNLSGLTFKYIRKDLSFENALFDIIITFVGCNFDILKNNKYIGTFKFSLDIKTEIATLEQLKGETVVRKYTYNLKSGEINTLTD